MKPYPEDHPAVAALECYRDETQRLVAKFEKQLIEARETVEELPGDIERLLAEIEAINAAIRDMTGTGEDGLGAPS